MSGTQYPQQAIAPEELQPLKIVGLSR